MIKPKINVYTSIEDREKYLKRYYTDEGVNALEKRLETLVGFYMKKDIKYPFSAKLFGFVSLTIHNREHLEGMVEELKQVLAIRDVEVEVR